MRVRGRAWGRASGKARDSPPCFHALGNEGAPSRRALRRRGLSRQGRDHHRLARPKSRASLPKRRPGPDTSALDRITISPEIPASAHLNWRPVGRGQASARCSSCQRLTFERSVFRFPRFNFWAIQPEDAVASNAPCPGLTPLSWPHSRSPHLSSIRRNLGSTTSNTANESWSWSDV